MVMPALVCDRVGPGMRDSERTVAIKDIQGRREYLRVPLGFLEIVGEVFYVPVGLVYEDPGRQVSEGLTIWDEILAANGHCMNA
jgi:hypothetical protein